VIAAAVLAEVPALPLHTAGKYVAGAYIVLFVLVLVYVAIMAVRLSHIEAELGDLLNMTERSDGEGEHAPGAGREHDGGRDAGPPQLAGELDERRSAPA
jgi:CcmD family protein